MHIAELLRYLVKDRANDPQFPILDSDCGCGNFQQKYRHPVECVKESRSDVILHDGISLCIALII